MLLLSLKGARSPANCRLTHFSSIPIKVIEQFILGTISRHMKDRKMIGSGQHEIGKGKSHLNSTQFSDQMRQTGG